MPKTKMQKREEAEARQQAYLARTANEQMRLASERPGFSEKETAKLKAQIEGGRHAERQAKFKKGASA